MNRLSLASLLALLYFSPVDAATNASAYSYLYGGRCQTLDSNAPGNALYPLSYWESVTPGYATVGQKAEWRMVKRNGKRVPTALLVRLTRLDLRHPGELIAVARIDRDGACVVYRGDPADSGVEQAARRAAADPASKCLGPYDASATE